MWKSAVGKGIVLLLRQMLLLLSAFAFNLFFKMLEYPIYRPRLGELIFGILPLKKVSPFFSSEQSTEAEWEHTVAGQSVENMTCGVCVCLCFSIVELQYSCGNKEERETEE